MTAQMNDAFRYQDAEYALAGISKGELFNPLIFGLHPMMASTACWRGYIATYAVNDSHLVLDNLLINLHDMDLQSLQMEVPLINGIKPISPAGRHSLFNNDYKDLNYRIHYTGGLLLGKGFIQELYVHMGFHPAWKYKKVIELIFENGVLTGEFDRSKRMAELRRTIEETSRENTGNSPKLDYVNEFIERSFDRSYTGNE